MLTIKSLKQCAMQVVAPNKVLVVFLLLRITVPLQKVLVLEYEPFLFIKYDLLHIIIYITCYFL